MGEILSIENPNRYNERLIDVERNIMSRAPEHNKTNLDLDRMKLILDILGHPEQSINNSHRLFWIT